MKNPYITFSEEAADALQERMPVLALESTIISHGMPYPENVESALTSERTARECGAVPATIAVIGGRIRIGLTPDEIDYLGRNSSIPKASRRDMALLISRKLDGATTVATTMFCAALAGIPIFATGGIGGVHRGAPQTFDVSADLQELAETNVAVVGAGVKSILDIGLTLEYLETHGVPVIGYRTDEFPAFYTRKSGFAVDFRLDTPQDAALAMKTKWELGLRGGLVIANPIPEAHEMEEQFIQEVIDEAVSEAQLQGIRGKHVTPFILARLHERTGNRSLAANKQLVYHNVRTASAVAVAYTELLRSGETLVL
jgi:pseudouridylate synthase